MSGGGRAVAGAIEIGGASVRFGHAGFCIWAGLVTTFALLCQIGFDCLVGMRDLVGFKSQKIQVYCSSGTRASFYRGSVGFIPSRGER